MAGGAKATCQKFQAGEIYAYGGNAFALYGPVLDHYRELLSGPVKDLAAPKLGLPITAVQTVTSSTGVVGAPAQFSSEATGQPTAAIYVSSKGSGAVWGGFRQLYFDQEGGHTGWLGFPLADEQYFADSVIQLFESGYLVYYFPKVPDNQRDWGVHWWLILILRAAAASSTLMPGKVGIQASSFSLVIGLASFRWAVRGLPCRTARPSMPLGIPLRA